jgi:4-diphosphocytidyl-2-C-methyl-D-erythritol kinase
VRRDAYAKVNLALAVTGRRADGFHTLASVFVRLELHDDVSVDAGEPGALDSVRVSGDPDCPVEGNLVLRAAAAVRAIGTREAPARELPGLTFDLEKRIPMGAGLAGGSTDAAAALDLAATSWGIRLDPLLHAVVSPCVRVAMIRASARLARPDRESTVVASLAAPGEG